MIQTKVLPIAVMAFAIVSFLVVADMSVNEPAKQSNTNTTNTVVTNTPNLVCTDDAKICPDGSAVGRTLPNCEFAACPAPVVEETISYTNTKYGFSLTFPKSWKRVSEFDGSASDIKDTDNPMGSYQASANDGAAAFQFQVLDRTAGLIHQNTLAYISEQENFLSDEPVIWKNVTVHKIRFTDGQINYYYFEHGKYLYQFIATSGPETEVLAVLQTLQLTNPDEPLVSVSAAPFKNVKNIKGEFPDFGTNGVSAVSVMGTKALVGGNSGLLFLYDGSKVTNLSSKIDTKAPGLDPKYIQVRGLANNGSYWLISTVRSGESDHLYKYDGTTWTDLSASYNPAQDSTMTGAAHKIIWTGTTWYFGENSGRLLRFNGTTFTNLTDLFPANNEIVGLEDIDWNGKDLLIVARTSENNGRVFIYNGTTIKKQTVFANSNTIQAAGWNGTEWLLGGNDNQKLLRFDGTKVTNTGVGSDAFVDIAWLSPLWMVSQYIFDGTTVETWASVGRVTQISIGSTYGLMGTYGGDLIRFDLRK